MRRFVRFCVLKNKEYQKQLIKLCDLHGVGEGAVLSFIKREFMTFEQGNVLDGESLITLFATYGFGRVLKEFSNNKMDFKELKSVETGEVLNGTVLDDYLLKAKYYDPDFLDMIIKAGGYSSKELGESFIKLCRMYEKALNTEHFQNNTLNLQPVLMCFYKNGMEFTTSETEVFPFHAFCSLYSSAKKKGISPAVQEMLNSCMQEFLDRDVDLNAIGPDNKTAFSFNDMEMKSRFVRHQKAKEDKRLLDLFMIMDQVVQWMDKKDSNSISDEQKNMLKGHILSLKKDVSTYQKRAVFYKGAER